MGTAYITLTILMVFYIIAFEPTTAGKPNPIDLGFLTAFRRVLKKIYRNLFSKEWVTLDNVRAQKWQHALNQVRYANITLIIPSSDIIMLTNSISVYSL